MNTKKQQYIECLLQEIIFSELNTVTLECLSNKLYDEPHFYLTLFFNGIEEVAEQIEVFLDERAITLAAIQDIPSITAKVKATLLARFTAIENASLVYKSLNKYYLTHGKIASLIKASWNTSDNIWHAVGDTSTDWNYYSKRAILSSLYLSTLRYFLAGGDDLNGYLDAKLEKIKTIGKLKGNIKNGLNKIPIVRMFLNKKP